MDGDEDIFHTTGCELDILYYEELGVTRSSFQEKHQSSAYCDKTRSGAKAFSTKKEDENAQQTNFPKSNQRNNYSVCHYSP